MVLFEDSSALHFLADVFGAASAGGCLYLIAAAVAVWRFPERDPTPAGSAEPVTVMKPSHGAEPNLSSRIASYCNQSYDGQIEVVCGVRDGAFVSRKAFGSS